MAIPFKPRKLENGKIYGVAHGRKTGVFSNKWNETKSLTDGFIGARYKSFSSTNDSWRYVLNENKSIIAPKCLNEVSHLSDAEIAAFRELVEKEVCVNKNTHCLKAK